MVYVPVWHQAITWIYVDQDNQHHMPSQGDEIQGQHPDILKDWWGNKFKLSLMS